VDGWRGRDPLALQASRVPDVARAEVDAAVETAVETAVLFAVGGDRPVPEAAQDYLYANPPQARRPGTLSVVR
jgi:hypothetical protein